MRATIGAILAFLWIVPGCGGNSAKTDAGEITSPSDAMGSDGRSDAMGSDGGSSASEDVGPDGGKVTKSDGTSVNIPSGALPETVTIQIESADVSTLAPAPTEHMFAGTPQIFTPHGTSFASPVTISLPYTGQATTILRLDDAADTTWAVVTNVTFANNIASFETNRFSVYAAAKAAATTCPDQEILCDEQCVDPGSNDLFCGATACGDDATDGEECTGGAFCDGNGVCATCQAVSPTPDACLLLTQQGCEQGEKCANVVVSLSPLLHHTDCVPNGTVDLGGACDTCSGNQLSYDNCRAGAHCREGVCKEICELSPDTCRTPETFFDEGSHCQLYAGLFVDATHGVCEAACDPLDDASCPSNQACVYLFPDRTVCATPVPLSPGQNRDCIGPSPGLCFSNGCAPGFTPTLPIGASQAICTRNCRPVNTHTGALSGAAGSSGRCTPAALTAASNAQITGEHQCRFLQTYDQNAAPVPEELGICLQDTICNLFDWVGIQNAWNTAIAGGQDPNLALDQFCLVTPSNPNSAVLSRCQGLDQGCISLAEKNLLTP